MKKIKQASAEVEFLQSADSTDILQYLSKHPLHKTTEKWFVETTENLFLRAYIGNHGLQDSSIIALLKANKRELVECAFLRHRQDPDKVKLILDHAAYKTAKYLVDTYQIPELPEQELLKKRDVKSLRALIAKGELSPYAKCDIIMRFDENLVMDVIRMGNLQTREFLALLSHCTYIVLQFVKEYEHNSKRRHLISQFELIRFKSRKKVQEYIAQKQFTRPAEEFFYQASEFDDLKAYVKKFKPADGEQALLHHPDRSKIITWLSKMKMPLSPEGEAILFKRGRHFEIKAYVKGHTLSPEYEARFIRRNKHREIMLYLVQHSLSSEAQIELIKRGNYNEIFVLITVYPLSDAAEETLKKYGPQTLWNMYNE